LCPSHPLHTCWYFFECINSCFGCSYIMQIIATLHGPTLIAVGSGFPLLWELNLVTNLGNFVCLTPRSSVFLAILRWPKSGWMNEWMSLIWCKFEKCSKCAMSTVAGVVAYVIKNVFSRVWYADNDMSSQSAAGKLFHTVGPLTAKLRSP